MEGGLAISLLSAGMFLGCFLLGLLPLLFSLSEKSLQFVSILGAGLLCGTALAVVVPEGVGLLQDSWTASSSSSDPSSLNISRNSSASSDGCRPPRTPRLVIGVSLTFGFTLMLAVDQACSQLSSHAASGRGGVTATLGLLIHAAADGFALGAAVATGQEALQLLVFVAVILHKAPAAFGLVSFLMHAGLEKKLIRGHLLAFSAAAPVVAIPTYFILHASGSSAKKQLTATGVGLLFSAGTFLYVATVHILPEVSSSRTLRPPPSDLQQQDGAAAPQQRHLGLLESLTLILGVGLPLGLAAGLRDD